LASNSSSIRTWLGTQSLNGIYYSTAGTPQEDGVYAQQLHGYWHTEENTAGVASPNVLTGLESFNVISNEGAVALNYQKLVSAAAGYEFKFVVQNANGMRLIASTGDTIRYTDTVSASSGYIESTNLGATILLRCINATEWFVSSISGTWNIDGVTLPTHTANVLFSPDATLDIGSAGAGDRPRWIYASSGLRAGTYTSSYVSYGTSIITNLTLSVQTAGTGQDFRFGTAAADAFYFDHEESSVGVTSDGGFEWSSSTAEAMVSVSNDTFLTRSAAGAIQVGATRGTADGSFAASTLVVGSSVTVDFDSISSSGDLYVEATATGGDLYFSAHGSVTPLNEVGDEALTTTGLSAISIVGAINELAAGSGGGGGETLAQTLAIGSTTGGTDLTVSNGDRIVGAIGLVLVSTTTGAVNIDSGTTGAINVGTGGFVKTIIVGNSTGATSVAINSGSGGATLDATGTVTIAGTNASALTLGRATLGVGVPGWMNVGSSALAVAVSDFAVGDGTNGSMFYDASISRLELDRQSAGLTTKTPLLLRAGNSTGAGGAGLGAGIVFSVETSSEGAYDSIGLLSVNTQTTLTGGNNYGDLILFLDRAGSSTETFRVGNSQTATGAYRLEVPGGGIMAGTIASITSADAGDIVAGDGVSQWLFDASLGRVLQDHDGSGTNDVIITHQCRRSSTGTPLVGFGQRYSLALESNSTLWAAGEFSTIWTTAGATPVSDFEFRVRNTSACDPAFVLHGSANSAGFINASGTEVVTVTTASPGVAFVGAATITTNAASTLGITTGTTGALTLDSGTTGAVNLGTNANAKTITLGNVTGATAMNYDAGSGGHTFTGDIGFYGTTPAAQSAAYTRNATAVEDRTLLASASATTTNNNNVLAALILDLQALGLIG
jgi:hypothetical protein